MNWIDILVLGGLAIGALRGFSTGIVRQALGLAGVVLAFALAIQLMSPIGALIAAITPVSEGFGPVVGFVAVFLAILVAVRIGGRMIETILKVLRLSMANRLAGGLFGAFQAAILLSLLFLVLASLDLPGQGAREESTTYEPIAVVFPLTWDVVAGQVPYLKQVSTEFGERIEAEIGL